MKLILPSCFGDLGLSDYLPATINDRFIPVDDNISVFNGLHELCLDRDSFSDDVSFCPYALQDHRSSLHQLWLKQIQSMPGTKIVVRFSDQIVGDECTPGLVTISPQAVRCPCGKCTVGCLYPLVDKAKIESIKKLVMPSSKKYDVGFIGWDNENWGNRYPCGYSRRNVVDKLKKTSLKLDIELYEFFKHGLRFEEWLSRAASCKVNLVMPGIGLNSWRLTELLAAGLPVVALKPMDKLALGGVHDHVRYSYFDKVVDTLNDLTWNNPPSFCFKDLSWGSRVRSSLSLVLKDA